MKINQIINRVTVEARAAGVDETTAAVKRLDGAVDGLTVANDRTAKTALSVAPALERLKRSTDLNYRAGQQLATGQRILQRSMQEGLITAVEQERMLARLQARYGSTATGATRLAAANDNLSRTSSASVASATALTRGIGGIAAVASSAAMALAAYGFAVVALGTSAAQTGMQMQALGRSFAAGTGSAVQGARELEFVRAESQRLGLAFTETAKQYGQLVAASRDTPLQGQATRDIFIAVSQAMTALGKSADDTGGALNAIQQMMSKGKVQAEELRGQLGERLPGAFGLAAAAMGKTTAELNKMLDDGKVLATDLVPKLAIELNKVYGAASAASANDLGANINRLKNAWQEYQDAVANGGLNEALNNATKALTGFLSEGDGAAQGRRLGDAINWIVTALERVPRGAENFGILTQMAREALAAFGAWIDSFSALQGVAVDASSSVGDSFSAAVGYVQTAINGVIGVAVGGYQMVTAAWQGLPSVFAEIATNAGNALINGIAAAVNYVIGLLNGMISSINGIGAKLPDAIGFKPIEEIASVTFKNIENTAAGSASRIGASLSEIGKDAASKNYLGEFGKSVRDSVDGQISRFRELRSAQDASNHLLREADKIAKNSKVADAYNNAAKAGKAAKEAAEGSGGAAKSAASSYENLIQRTKDRIEELQLEAQYASKTATEVIKLKLAHDLERAAKKDGTEVTAAMRAEWDKLGGELAEATQNLERVRKAQNDLKKAQDAVADSFKSLVEDLLTGSDGINGALKSLGKSFLSSSLDALISGKGPLAGITGLASSTKDGQGGILGALTGSLQQLPKAVKDGAKAGSVDGVTLGFGTFASNDNFSWLGKISGKDLAGGLTAIAGLAGAYGSGMAAGSYAQAVGGGALSGGMGGLALAGTSIGASLGGAAVLGPIGVIAGAALGYFGQQQARKQAKEERQRQAQENYREAAPQIVSLGSQLRGEAQGTLLQQFEEAMAATRKLGDVAFFAGKYDEQAKLWADLATYKTRIYTEFAASYQGFVDALNMGVGPGGAFNTAKDAVKALGDQLKVFTANTDEVFGTGSAASGEARQAAASYALSTLAGSKELSTVATRMEEIRGVGAGLTQVLTDLGVSAEMAAAVIRDATGAALTRLRETFETDLLRRTSEAQGYGYVNEVGDLLKEFATLQKDAAALGSDPALVANYFKAAAQEIVDGAQLAGSAFDQLLVQFPELVGHVTAFTGALKGAAREADIAARKLSYEDRYFNATTDTSSLSGQLLAFDRMTQRQREEEIRKGGEALTELERAISAERIAIIKEDAKRQAEIRRQAFDEAKNYLEGALRNIRDYLARLRAGPDSPLDPLARLNEAQSQFDAQLALARSGDRDALNGITRYADTLLEAGRGFYASSDGFQAIFAQIQTALGALPNQLSAEQFIVDAIDRSAEGIIAATTLMQAELLLALISDNPVRIAETLTAQFDRLDTSLDGLLSPTEFIAGLGPLATKAEQELAKTIFRSIDENGDGLISAIELMRNSLMTSIQANNANAFATALNANFNRLDASVNGLLDFNELLTGLGPLATKAEQELAKTIFNRIDLDGDGQISRLEALKTSTDGVKLATDSVKTSTDGVKTATDNSRLVEEAIRNNIAQSNALLTVVQNLNSAISVSTQSTATSLAYQVGTTDHVYAMRRSMQQQNANWGAQNQLGFSIPGYARGGLIGGIGTGTSDSNLIRASRGEFMVSKAAVDHFGPDLFRSMNDNLRLPPMPRNVVPMMGGDREAAAEIRALRKELAEVKSALVRATVAGAEHIREGLDDVAAGQKDAARQQKIRAA